MIVKNDPKVLAYRKERNAKKRRALANQLVKENLALVAKIVDKFSRWAPDGVDRDDLMQAGYIAFLFTLDNIDISRTFSTYFAFRVWYEVSKCCEKAGLIYKPRGSMMPFKVVRKIDEFMTKYGRPPTAEELGVTQAKLDAWAESPTTVSLDAPGLGEDGPAEPAHERVPDSRPNPEQNLAASEDKTRVSRALAALPEGQRRVLALTVVDGLSDAQAAEVLAVPAAWVESTREAGLARLRTLLKEDEK